MSFSSSLGEDRLLWDLLQTSVVQRLRRIKQLGFSEFVYPGATHTRLSHVIGAMAMARKMLAVFERNSVFQLSNEHSLKKKATLSAALLHDIGHGPYSHVFEDVMEAFGAPKRHEAYTKEMIHLPEIKSLLDREGVFDETIRFFSKEPGDDPYRAIISSQMDCDRLDFLLRDRYFTGTRSSALDIDWLFDSLRIEEVPIDAINAVKGYSFVVLPKGIGAAEEFVIGYVKMYQNIYFHKATRAVQHLVKDALLEIIKLDLSRENYVYWHPLLRFIQDKGTSVHEYMKLDDSSLISLLSMCAHEKFGKASELSQRFLNRDLYKAIELIGPTGKNVSRVAVSRFIDDLKSEKIYHVVDVVSAKGYKQFEVMEENFVQNILVKTDNDYVALGRVSPTVASLPEGIVRVYFSSLEDRDRAKKLWKDAQA